MTPLANISIFSTAVLIGGFCSSSPGEDKLREQKQIHRPSVRPQSFSLGSKTHHSPIVDAVGCESIILAESRHYSSIDSELPNHRRGQPSRHPSALFLNANSHGFSHISKSLKATHNLHVHDGFVATGGTWEVRKLYRIWINW